MVTVQRAFNLKVKHKMAASDSQNPAESFKTNDDMITLSNMHICAGTKRAGSRSPSPERPHKSPRTSQSENNTAIPRAEQEQAESQEGMQVEEAHQEEGQMKEQESKGDGPALSPRSRRRSWRRSARSRRSFPALPSNTPALCRAISPSLPEEERLEKLMESSMQQVLLKLQESLHSTPGASLERLQEQVETVQREWCRLAQDIRQRAQSRPSQTDTQRGPGVQKTMDQIKKSIHRLQTECGLWDSLLLRHRSKSEELARRVEQGRAEGVALDASCLAQSSQSQFILRKPDYHSALHRQQAVLHTMELLMDSQSKMMRELMSFQEQSHMLVKETSRRLASSAGFQLLPSSPVRRLLAGSHSLKRDPLTSDTAGHALVP